MVAVIFEVWPDAAHPSGHFDLAAALRPELDTIGGFISIERFESLATPGKFLSLSFWRDEEAVRAWRNRPSHRETQTRGRAGVLTDYRLRVASVLPDYGLADRAQAPADSRQLHG